MIDILTVIVPHALMALAIWRLTHRNDLDDDPALPNRRAQLMQRQRRAPSGGKPRA
ncbi:MAG: hypothetical protein RIS94_560 [Pseudomonadota bacterium]|jgi:hypothetical protein